MELNGFSLLQMDNIRMQAAPPIHNPQNFTEMVRRASAAGPVVETRPREEPIDKNDKLYQLCLELETFLVKNLLTSMRNTVQKSGLIDESFAGKMYEDMLYDEYAKDFTRNANFGLAEQAYRQLKRL
jgi:flagellar protein FlgJ